MSRPQKIRCNNVAYRKGYIEVTPDIHEGRINLETWSIHPDFDISNIDLTDDQFPDESVIGNTELEMSVEETEQLIERLKTAINKVKACG